MLSCSPGRYLSRQLVERRRTYG